MYIVCLESIYMYLQLFHILYKHMCTCVRIILHVYIYIYIYMCAVFSFAGRINVVDLQQVSVLCTNPYAVVHRWSHAQLYMYLYTPIFPQMLNVDLCHIEARVADVMKHDRSLTLLQGELIDRCSVLVHIQYLHVYICTCMQHVYMCMYIHTLYMCNCICV